MTDKKILEGSEIGDLFSGIGPRLLLYVLLFSSLITLTLTAIQFYLDYQNDVQVLEKRFEDIETLVIPSLAESIWKIDRKQVEVQLDGLLQMPDFQFVEIIDADPSSLVISRGEHASENIVAHSFPILCTCGSDGEEILGQLRIEASLDRIYASLIQRGLVLLGSQGVKTFLVSFFLLFVFHILVTRHLVSAAHAMSKGETVHLNRGLKVRGDELDQLVSAYNSINSQYRETLIKADELARHNASLLENLPANLVRIKYYPDGKKELLSAVGDQMSTNFEGLTPEEWPRYFHPDDRELLFKTVVERLRDTGFSEHRFRLKTPDGGYSWRLAHEKVIERFDDGTMITEAIAININDQMETQLAKERSDRIFQDLIHALPVGVFVIDNEGQVNIYNEAAVSIWGRRPKSNCPHWLNDTWTYPDGTSLDQDDDGEVNWVLDVDENAIPLSKRPMTKAIADGRSLSKTEMNIRQPNGALVPVITYPSPLRDVDGSIIGAFNVMVDVSESKLTETTLRAREQEYRTLVENSEDVIIRYDRDARRLYMNPTALGEGQSVSKFLGKMPSESGMSTGSPSVRERSFQSLIPLGEEEHLPSVVSDHAQVTRGYEDAIRDVVRNRRKTEYELAWQGAGDSGFFHVNFLPEFDDEGNVTSVLTVGRDISARKAAEQRLARRERQYRTLLENAPVLILRYDANLYRVFVNRAWEELSGVPAVDIIGTKVDASQKAPFRTSEEFVEALHNVLNTGDPQAIEIDWESPSANNYSLEFMMVREVDESGNVLGVLVIGRDNTEEKQLQQERKRLDAHMEATRTLQSLGQLAGGIAHDFNNLLGAIMGFALFIAEDAASDSSISGYARRILAAGRQGKSLVEQILTFSKHGEMETSVFPLSTVVREMKDIIEVAIPSSIGIVVNIDDENAMVAGDREHIGQVILNLAINAKDAYEGRPGEIVLSLRPPVLTESVAQVLAAEGALLQPVTWSEADGAIYTVYGGLRRGSDAISLIVEDHGIGMDETVMQKMFTPFFTSKASHGGTGLGLTVIQTIVQAHGGAIVVRSHPGQGTNIKVMFPLVEAVDVQPDRRKVSPRPKPDSLASTRILFVDDDEDFGDMLSTAMERRGAEVAVCNNPKEILDVLKEAPEPWHLLVTDQTMPCMRGTDLIPEVKKIRPDLPCILCTGYAEGVSEKDCLEAGADAMLRKPLDIEKLVETILGLISAE